MKSIIGRTVGLKGVRSKVRSLAVRYYNLLFLIFIALPAFAGVDLIKVNKSERKMYLLSGGKTVKEYDVALGANPKGHKQQEGDKKTLEGEYTLDYKKEDSSFYRAMHISYPNEADVANAYKRGVSPGGFIMVHRHHYWFFGC